MNFTFRTMKGVIKYVAVWLLTVCCVTAQQRVAPGVPPQQYVQHGQPQQVPVQHQQVPVQHQQIPVQHQQVPVQHQQVPVQQVPVQQQIPVQQQQQQQQIHHAQHPQQGQILNAANIAQEKQHIQEHLEVPIDTSKMSDQELQFHYFKMHDADNNNKLDGCELIKSLIHWHEELTNAEITEEPHVYGDKELEELVDIILKENDKDEDGFIDYTEYRTQQEKQWSSS